MDMRKKLTGQVIKHRDDPDMAYWVKIVMPFGRKMVVRGHLLNLGIQDTFFEGILETFSIGQDELTEWEMCLDINQRCLRWVAWQEVTED